VAVALAVVGVILALVVAAGATLTVQEKCVSQTRLNQQRPGGGYTSPHAAPDRTNSTCSWRIVRR
jgi:hypothetical protein